MDRLTKTQKKALRTVLVGDTRRVTKRQSIQAITRARDANKKALDQEIAAGRDALRVLLREGPFVVDPSVLAEVDTMSDAEVLKLKYEMRDLLRAIAAGNDRL